MLPIGEDQRSSCKRIGVLLYRGKFRRGLGHPQMQHGIGAPRPPRLGAGEQFARLRSPTGNLERALYCDVAGEEGVALAQRAHGDILRRPFADAGQTTQLLDGFIEIAAAMEQIGLRDSGCRERRERRCAGPRHAETSQYFKIELVGCWEAVRQSFDGAFADWLTECTDEFAAKACRGLHCDLLTEHCPHRNLESVPRAGQTQPRPCGDERREMSVARQGRSDGDWVRAKVEETTDA